MPGKKIQLFLKGLRNETRAIRIDKDASIEALLDKTSELSGVPKDEQRIVYCSKEIRPVNDHGEAQYLSDYNIRDLGNLTLILRLSGGSDEEKPEQPKTYGPDVELTDLPDMFTMDDEEGGQRALMPCKHAIGPESLTAYCRSLLSAGKFQFRCPYKAKPSDPFCDRLWDFFIVRKLAVLTEEEVAEFEIKISENYLWKAVGMQQCPGCKSFCERRNKKDRRVVCPICTKDKKKSYDFCWYCLKPWLKPRSTTECGNVSCTGQDPRLRILMTCPTKNVVGVPCCPDVRACPKCGLLIQHKEACKQMDCPCKQKFCFICLKMAKGKRYQCGSWNTRCEVAPRQTTIPGD